ncbi:MAG: hemolysin family protein, partial [Gemmatimonadaceae bacterium]
MFARLLAILILVLLNAFFVGAQIAAVRARRPRLEARARTGDRLAAIALRAVANPQRMVSAAQLGITLATLGLGWLLADWLNEAYAMRGGLASVLTIAAAIALIVYLHAVFGELAPRHTVMARPESAARFLTPPLLAFAWLTAPFTSFLDWSAYLVTRVARENASPDDSSVPSSDELRLLVERSEESGALETADADLLEGVFEFSEKNAREVMTPRTEIVALAKDSTLEEALSTIEETGFSRYPIYEGTIDDIVGVVLAKDLLPLLRRTPMEFSLANVMRRVHMVPGTREVEEVLADFKRLKEHIAVVLDEYGGTAGIVTMEDLLEEIVGEILDEYDEREPAIGTARGGEIIVPGETNIGELNEHYGLAVPDTDYTTVGGYVFGALGRLPRPGDREIAGGGVFTVRDMEG